jgi:hypothetical protein
MKKIIIVVMCILFTVSLVQGEKLGVLGEVLKPDSIEISGDRLYVVEGATFLVYSLEDLKLIDKFGREGEGPGELKTMPFPTNSIVAFPDKLFVDGAGKVIFFSRDGKLLKEIRKKGNMTFTTRPVGKNFLAVHAFASEKDKKFYLALSLLDPEMNAKKMLYKQEYPESDTEIPMIIDSLHFEVYKDKIYVEESDKGFFIEVFDSSGSRLYEIKKDFTAPEIANEDKKTLLEDFKNDHMSRMMINSRGGWENFKKTMNFIYPRTFPCIQDIIVTGDKIYVLTYDKKGDKEKVVIMDLEGKVIGTSYLPIPQKSSYTARALGRDNRYYAIVNNKFYYVKESETDENWEFHVTEIK